MYFTQKTFQDLANFKTNLLKSTPATHRELISKTGIYNPEQERARAQLLFETVQNPENFNVLPRLPFEGFVDWLMIYMHPAYVPEFTEEEHLTAFCLMFPYLMWTPETYGDLGILFTKANGTQVPDSRLLPTRFIYDIIYGLVAEKFYAITNPKGTTLISETKRCALAASLRKVVTKMLILLANNAAKDSPTIEKMLGKADLPTLLTKYGGASRGLAFTVPAKKAHVEEVVIENIATNGDLPLPTLDIEESKIPYADEEEKQKIELAVKQLQKRNAKNCKTTS